MTQSNAALISWMHYNVYPESGIPKSYEVPQDPREAKEFWSQIGSGDGVMERLIINDGLSTYEAAVWQAALVMAGGRDNFEAVDRYTDMLDSGSFGQMQEIRAWKTPYRYQGRRLTKRDGFFFRFISPRYFQTDPLTGEVVKPGYPEFDNIHWVDWLPILGENAWVIIGLLQTAYAKGQSKADQDSKEVKLALSLFPAIKALRTKVGGVLFSPSGAWNKDPGVISTENNISLYAALEMLYAVTKDPQYLEIACGIKNFFKNHCFDKKDHKIYQGGIYKAGKFFPDKRKFALDCQTWAILALSPARIDGWYGPGEAYKIWKSAKKHAGYYEDGRLCGVGFVDGHEIQSAEWTWGAIGAVNELALYYQKTRPDWAGECLADSLSMLKGLEKLKHTDKDGHQSYLYANKRYYIPWGWWANPIPNLVSTAWAYLIQNGYNPFKLGQKTRWSTLSGLQAAVKNIEVPLYKTNISQISMQLVDR